MTGIVRLEINTTAGEKILKFISNEINPKILLKAIGARFLSFVDQSFKTRGRGAWRPLAMSTIWMRKHGGSMPLQDSGRYRQSYVEETDGQTYVEVGSNLRTPDGRYSLARIHEYGTDAYTIRVKAAKVLAARGRFGGAIMGSTMGGSARHHILSGFSFFGKEVHHPGVPARPVLPNKEVAEKIVQETIDAVMRRAAGAQQ